MLLSDLKGKNFYKVTFLKNKETFEISVLTVKNSELTNFIEISDFVFFDDESGVINSEEEKIKKVFDNIITVIIPRELVIGITEVHVSENMIEVIEEKD